jgi:hypothetical protein
MPSTSACSRCASSSFLRWSTVLCFVSRSEARPTMSGCVSGGATTSFVIVTSADVPSFTSRLSLKLVARFAPPMAGSDIGGTPRSSKGTWPEERRNLSAFSHNNVSLSR